MINLNIFLVKERVAVLVDTYDIFDPESDNQVGVAKGEPVAWAKTAKENAQPGGLTARKYRWQ